MCSRAISSFYFGFFYSRIMEGYFRPFVLNNAFLIKKNCRLVYLTNQCMRDTTSLSPNATHDGG
jgi:hypothetical protein